MDNKKGEVPSHSSIFLKSKRGQGLSVNAIILIVLGMVVLVLMILGFTLGWSKVLPFIGTNNVNNIVTSCSTACSTNSQFDFCLFKRELKADEANLKDITCNYISKNQTRYGVAACPSVTCDNVILVTAVSDVDFQNKCTGNAGKTIQALIANTLVSKDCALTQS